MLRLAGRTAIIVALCLAIGLHWIALQSIAWTAMLVQNTKHVSLTEAVARTFDGAHPCGLCHAVATGKKSEKKSDALTATVKIDLICTTRIVAVQPLAAPYQYASVLFLFTGRDLAPPAPPPRRFPG
jgi:hypothetical protein